ncbi:MAG: hypothetical protein WDO68_25265 [Gammaproteobacteria bacterium]
MNSLNVLPEAISTMWLNTSKPATALYAQRVPGWNSSGAAPSASVYLSPSSRRFCEILAPAALPTGPLSNPDVCVSRSRIVTSRATGTV